MAATMPEKTFPHQLQSDCQISSFIVGSNDCDSVFTHTEFSSEYIKSVNYDTFENDPHISAASTPREPPHKKKGRPRLIMDSGCQTDNFPLNGRAPLREVTVQCNREPVELNPSSYCPTCSCINWEQMENEIMSCVRELNCDTLCEPSLASLLITLTDDTFTPSHAINILRIIAGLQPHSLQMNDVVLSSDIKEVQIEKVIYPEADPIEGIREIVPRPWFNDDKERNVLLKDHSQMELTQHNFNLSDKKFDKGCFSDQSFDEESTKSNKFLNDDESDEDWDHRKEDKYGAPKRRKIRKQSKQHRYKKKNGCLVRKNKINFPIGMTNHDHSIKSKSHLEKGFKYKESGMNLNSFSNFDSHIMTKHSKIVNHAKEFRCFECLKTFSQKISLKVHNAFKHGGPKPFSCELCSYRAPTKEYLKRHMKVHSKERNFTCEICGKKLKSVYSYRYHQTIHTKIGRYNCNVCNKAFNHKGAYMEHQQSHYEERSFTCDLCDCTFKLSRHLHRHHRYVHLNEKRFLCDICGAKFFSAVNLKSHMKKHIDCEHLPFCHNCIICNVKFRGFPGLESHLRTIHQINDVSQMKHTSPSSVPYPSNFINNNNNINNEKITDLQISDTENFNYLYLDSDNCQLYDDDDCKDDLDYEVFKTELCCNDEIDPIIEVTHLNELDLQTNLSVMSNEVENISNPHIINIYSCLICSAIYTSDEQLQQHKLSHF